jgi:hypothetical protein
VLLRVPVCGRGVPCERHALCENLLYDILQHVLLATDIENDGGSRGAGVAGFGTFSVSDDDGVAERTVVL